MAFQCVFNEYYSVGVGPSTSRRRIAPIWTFTDATAIHGTPSVIDLPTLKRNNSIRLNRNRSRSRSGSGSNLNLKNKADKKRIGSSGVISGMVSVVPEEGETSSLRGKEDGLKYSVTDDNQIVLIDE